MQLLSALLAGFFFWLMLFRLFRRRRMLARAEAGPLLLAVRLPRWITLMPCVKVGIIIVMLLSMLAFMARIMVSLSPQHRLPDLHSSISGNSFALCVHLTIWVSIFLFCIAPSNRGGVAFEVRERGILQISGSLRFVPWSKITECRWFAAQTLLGIPLHWWTPKRFAHSRFIINERSVARGQKDAITAALARFAPVFDRDGGLLASPERTDDAPIAAAPPRPCRWQFQFDLQTLLLSAVVVSCIASCYGMHERRLRPQREAFAAMKAFQPFSIGSDDVVTWLDFSRRDKKPGDADLVSLEPLEDLMSLDLSDSPITDVGLAHLKGLQRLEILDLSNCAITDAGLSQLKGLTRLDMLRLSGCPITDAGLTSLEGLQSLRYLSLGSTRVTANGVARLHRALPNTEIGYGPSSTPVIVHGADHK